MVMLNAQNHESEDDISGRARPEPGRYHAAINKAEEKASKKKATPGLEVEFQIVTDGLKPDGKTQTHGQSGRVISLFLSYIGGDEDKTKTCLDRVTRLALASGVLRPGEEKEVDWSAAIGRELVIEIVSGKYQDRDGNERTGSELAFLGFWRLANKNVLDVPKDPSSPGMQHLAKTGGATPPKQANSGAAAGPSSGTQAGAAGQAKRSKYADL